MGQSLRELCDAASKAVDDYEVALTDLASAISDLVSFDTLKDETATHYISEQLGEPLEDLLGELESEEPEANAADYARELIERLSDAIDDAEEALEEDKKEGLI